MSHWIIKAPPEVVLHNINNVEARRTWEENYEVDDILQGNCYHGIERVVVKSPVMGFSKREIIRFRKTSAKAFQYPYLCLERSTNCMDHKYPLNKKVVRVNVTFSGNVIVPGPEPWTTKYWNHILFEFRNCAPFFRI